MGILDIRDQLANARDLVGCLYIACRGMQSDDERGALSALSLAVREQLQSVDEAMQVVIGSA